MRSRRSFEVDTGKIVRRKATRSDRCGKMSYTSRKIAAQAAKASTRETGELIEAYHCRRGCHAWHIGHPPGSRGEHHAA